MSRLPKPGGDIGKWGSVLNDYLSVEHNDDGTLKRGSDITTAKIQAAAAQSKSEKGQPDGYAPLDSNSKVPQANLPAVNITADQVGLGNVQNLDQANPSNITQDATHRFATDVEKSTWNGKQDSLGLTTESLQAQFNARGFNVKDYGAKGDGSTDDTAAINAALSALQGQSGVTGGLLYFPSGTYIISSAITPGEFGITIAGAGVGNTILKSSTLTTVINLTSASQYCTLKGFTLQVTRTGDGTIKAVRGVGAMNLRIEECRIWVVYPMLGSYGDRAIDLANCYYSALRNTTVTITSPTDASVHALTGLSCYRMSGAGIYSDTNNALYISDCQFENCGRAMSFNNDIGVMVSGGAAEHYDQAIRLVNSSKCNIVGIRLETHPENTIQLLPSSSQQCGIFFDAASYDNEVFGTPFINPSLYHPHNIGVIDLSPSGRNRYKQSQGKSLANFRPLVRNGNFERWDGANTLPVGWVNKSATLTHYTTFLPPDPGVKNVCKVATTTNGYGIESEQFWFDPAQGNYISLRAWVERVSGTTGLWRFSIWDVAANTYLYSDIGPFTAAGQTKANNASWDTWQEYHVILQMVNCSSARYLTFRINQDGATACSVLVGGVTLLQGCHYDMPFLPDPGPLYASVTYNPPSITAGATTTTTVSITGVTLGDSVKVTFDKDNSGLLIWGYVSSADTITACLFNPTAGAVDLASGNLFVTVTHR